MVLIIIILEMWCCIDGSTRAVQRGAARSDGVVTNTAPNPAGMKGSFYRRHLNRMSL